MNSFADVCKQFSVDPEDSFAVIDTFKLWTAWYPKQGRHPAMWYVDCRDVRGENHRGMSEDLEPAIEDAVVQAFGDYRLDEQPEQPVRRRRRRQ